MNYLLALITRHGYLLVTGIVFAESAGLPCPAALALVAGGAAVASGILSPVVWLLALGAMLLGDSLLYFLGRHMGWALLGFLCKVSANPETCILRSAESFYKRGKIALLVAKFIPGVNTMAPPLAGSMKMRPLQFLRFDLAGATLYTAGYFTVGYVFRDFLAAITRGFQTAGRAFEEVLVVALVAYLVYRVWLSRKHRIYRVVPRVRVEELARKLASDERNRLLVVDCRSHGYYDPGSARIQGSIRIEPNNLGEELKTLPKDKDLYLYCT
ncbi:MAG TPA: VTT domain-containing protein [Terriglobales bacterium]|jgi:membrane protein DedA with SNARE-associated domain|nr:VTT domain-containing protein [Terriglobales bacterium]